VWRVVSVRHAPCQLVLRCILLMEAAWKLSTFSVWRANRKYLFAFKAWASELLQLRVLRLGLLQDGNVGVGVFPEGEEVLVRPATTRGVTIYNQGPSQL
jgi:hypothetical protein